MDIANTLINIGLKKKETKLYLALLELHEAPASVIAKRSSIERTLCYTILDGLTKKGLVSHFTSKGKRIYRASPPHVLHENFRRKFAEFENIMPELMKLHERYPILPQMSLYEGTEGIIQAAEDTLTAKSEMLAWSNINFVKHHEDIAKYATTYNAKKVERKIQSRCIFAYNQEGLDYKKRQTDEFREIYLVPEESFLFKNEIDIYDNKIAIFSFPDKAAVIIENEYIADTMRAIFELSYLQAKIIEHSLLTREDQSFLSS